MRRLDPERAESVAGKAHALSDPTRLTLAAALLGADELCVCDLAWIVERAQNLVSHHVRTLRAHGIVRSRREGKMVMYALTDEGRALLEAVLQSAAPRPKRYGSPPFRRTTTFPASAFSMSWLLMACSFDGFCAVLQFSNIDQFRFTPTGWCKQLIK